VGASRRVQVAVGILVKADQSLLIQQRRPGSDCAGLWEFPGGKLEAGELPEAALRRELREELDIEVIDADLLSTLEHDYAHACVSLHTYLVHQWSGEPKGAEGQEIAWGSPEKLIKYDLLEAAYPLLTQATARLMKV
jgi:8-oxo-dGTP diphosphatase